MKEALPPILAILGAVVIAYFMAVYTISVTQTSDDQRKCERVDGQWNGELTGDNYIIDTWSAGASGQCIKEQS